ncbi:phage tail protein [Nitratidesulfovibrio vulgaris]|uniref:phage tail protein n=1 Tax=Nitratidesulfovibrio vulgaris TaxID=881 RepID=UPI0023009DED|nr:phage tail protein [Nitratidesulfovibrio vulgaris]WCB45029.1 phage tail protein [Nitratidesulfovibrio vulgaris]
MPRVTIVPADSLVIVDGRGLNVSLTLPGHVHAIQWDGRTGWVEHNDGTPNTPVTQTEYDVLVVPALAAWESARAAADAPPPPLTLEQAKATKLAAIRAGHDAALAGVIALSDPTPTTVAVEAALLAATDLTGLEYARQKLAMRRNELVADVESATTTQAVEAIQASYPV